MSGKISMIAALVVALLFCACTPRAENLKNFDNILQAYHRAIQYGEVDEASNVVATSNQIEFIKKADEIAKLGNIVDFRIRKVVMSEDQKEATVLVVREFYDSSNVVRQIELTQKWKKKKKGGWVLMNTEY